MTSPVQHLKKQWKHPKGGPRQNAEQSLKSAAFILRFPVSLSNYETCCMKVDILKRKTHSVFRLVSECHWNLPQWLWWWRYPPKTLDSSTAEHEDPRKFTGKSSHEGPDSGTTKNEYLSHFMTIGSVAAEIYASGQMEDQTHQHHITNYREIIMFHLFLVIEKNTSR